MIPQQPQQPTVTLEMLVKAFDRETAEINDDVKKKITFALNNLGNNNVEEKALEIRPYLMKDENVMKWFCKYIVYNRAPSESNFHQTYIALTTKIDRREMFKIMIKETCRLLQRALDNPKLYSNEKDVGIEFNKTNLKNLGSFLGLITLARNKPIIMKEFDIKRVIIEAYENQRMELIIPFICKVLAGATQATSIFKPNNAWMNAILSLLAEINDMNIKISLKCEVEILFGNLNIEKNSIFPSRILQSRNKKKVQADNQLTINELP